MGNPNKIKAIMTFNHHDVDGGDVCLCRWTRSPGHPFLQRDDAFPASDPRPGGQW